MRALVVIGALLTGILGLFMSLCGGGCFILLASTATTGIRGTGIMSQFVNALPILLLAASSAAVGVWLCSLALKWLWGKRQD